MVLDPEHVHRILDASPEPFATAETLKRHALKHFEPKVSLISHGEERTQRRQLNEAALDTDHPIHRMAESFMPAVREEAEGLLREVDAKGGTLEYPDFYQAWFRVVRRVVLGDSHRDDRQITDLTEKLRGRQLGLPEAGGQGRPQGAAGPDRRRTQQGRAGQPCGLHEGYGLRPGGSAYQPGAAVVLRLRSHGMASARSLALLAEHPEHMAKAREQIAAEGAETAPMLQHLRGTVLESLRLWATTPMILRETTREVEFEHGVMLKQARPC
ncbi:hypothetical protein [Nesterenkonia pannonica]|uniref:hypothetical protein n=1 Tax=Nesterenkonia pannonica TaxID=1548602 RepID=UPI0021643D8A|nr:hypothetical protein [Nesterenkonia pannonica]